MGELKKRVEQFEQLGRGEHHLTPLLLAMAEQIEANEEEIEKLKESVDRLKLREALQDIIDECPNPKSSYGIYIVEVARAALAPAEPESQRFSEAYKLVQEQAEDEALWFITERATEAYLQQELRRLHAVIEKEHIEPESGEREQGDEKM